MSDKKVKGTNHIKSLALRKLSNFSHTIFPGGYKNLFRPRKCEASKFNHQSILRLSNIYLLMFLSYDVLNIYLLFIDVS